MYFGYKLLKEQEYTIRLAEPEKVILDYFYLNTLNSIEDINEMRFNEVLIKESINLDRLHKYLQVFDSKILAKRIKLFLKVIDA